MERNNLNKQQHLLAQKKEERRKITWVNKSVHVSLIEEPIVFFIFYIFANVLYCTAQCKTSPRYCIQWHRFFEEIPFWNAILTRPRVEMWRCHKHYFILFEYYLLDWISSFFLLTHPRCTFRTLFPRLKPPSIDFLLSFIFINSCFRFYLILLSFIFLSQEKNNKIKK